MKARHDIADWEERVWLINPSLTERFSRAQRQSKMSGDDLRLGDILLAGDEGNIVLIGFPYDEGVRRNSGRVGAKLGPKAFRQSLQRTGTVVNAEYEDLDLRRYLKISDGGNIPEDLTLEDAHQRLEQRIEQLLQRGKLPFVIGGGNDQSYPNASALLSIQEKSEEGSGPLWVINIDAHLDVRPMKEGNKVHSGSPFRLLMEDQRFKANPSNRLIEFACQGSQCSIEHVNYLRHRSDQATIFWFNQIRDHPQEHFRSLLHSATDDRRTSIFVSFDIDSIISASCPGVSAPATVGLSADEACQLAFIAGQSLQVKLFDLSEFNPIIEDYRTGKLVAMIFYHFLLGRATTLREMNNTLPPTSASLSSH